MFPRSAGILIPLFSLRTEDDLGRGEIMQMRAMIDFALAMGHRVIQLLPIDETAPDEASPYNALSVFAIDPLYVSASELAGVGRLALKRARRSASEPSDDPSPSARFVPRAAYVAAKRELLERAFERFASRARRIERDAFDDFLHRNSYWLDDYALFRALKDRFEFRSWEEWPGALAGREPGALATARRELASEVRKYLYFQFVAHLQWNAVREYARERGAFIGGDLAFSPSRDSAEVWAHQEMFDLSRTVGTPPDEFNRRGQRWGLPMPNWEVMRAEGLELWRSRVRHARELYDCLRVDHVVGMYRTFSFGSEPDDRGTFFPSIEEEQRAQGEAVIRATLEEAPDALIIAEDLGTVPPWVRQSLAALGVPGYKVMMWERKWDEPDAPFISPHDYPELSLATTGTHDTDTLAVWWRECPLEERTNFVHALGLDGRVHPEAPLKDAALDAVIEALYAGRSMVAILPIQDLFGWEARINRPGTISATNWTYRLPLGLERMAESGAIRKCQRLLLDIARRTGRFAAQMSSGADEPSRGGIQA